MRIAQVAPLWEPVPPRTYGGTELVVYNLVQELSRLGHEITVFATGDSVIPEPSLENGTQAGKIQIVPMETVSLREQGIAMGSDYAKYTENRMIAEIIRRSGEFDIIHNHLGFQMFPLAHWSRTPIVTTLHGTMAKKEDKPFLAQYAHMPLVSISEYQQTPQPDLNYVGNIYHGIELAKVPANLNTSKDSYLAFLGRLSPEKGPLEAIAVAKATGRKLMMAGKINSFEEKFFREQIQPLIDGDQIRYIGELNHEEKVAFLGNAAATLCPLKWPEPFGLVLAESMACGTPVFAFANGSVPEIVQHELSGYVGSNVDDLICAVQQLDNGMFDRAAIRQYAEERFSRQRMAQDYIRIYQSLCTDALTESSGVKPELKKSARIYSVMTSYGAGNLSGNMGVVNVKLPQQKPLSLKSSKPSLPSCS
ncbi:MAG: glycosyltransferase family 4 protein [Vampirovibrionales bacterium]|nr:glycosyltransferase family 4 protein [Vampirovibrionales bacterium]